MCAQWFKSEFETCLQKERCVVKANEKLRLCNKKPTSDSEDESSADTEEESQETVAEQVKNTKVINFGLVEGSNQP